MLDVSATGRTCTMVRVWVSGLLGQPRARFGLEPEGPTAEGPLPAAILDVMLARGAGLLLVAILHGTGTPIQGVQMLAPVSPRFSTTRGGAGTLPGTVLPLS
jgi:hypothetical protein